MPACKDLIGQKFNKLLVIRKTDERRHNSVVWERLCDCGKTRCATSVDLKHNRVKSCGCSTYDKIEAGLYNNLAGQKVGKLTVLELSSRKTSNRCRTWKCICECGNICEVASENLNLNSKRPTLSCGCLKAEKVREYGKSIRGDLTQRKFGKLQPISITSDEEIRIWHCKCDCGNECDVQARYLLNGHKRSCGCLRTSYGEYIIEKILTDNNIIFEKEKSFESCKFADTDKLARFDFYVNNQYIIEFDGVQHYEENYFLNTSLEKVQEHDKIKNQWCFSHNIPIIRIPYYESNNITLKDLLLETSTFILKEES